MSRIAGVLAFILLFSIVGACAPERGSGQNQGAQSLMQAPPEYDRDRFGEPWEDVDGNGCDTRNDILQRDLVEHAVDAGGCRVVAGVLLDPYTDQTIHFVRGPESGRVQIDHVVPLAWAWEHGASEWSDTERIRFANDPVNLRAVAGWANSAKGAAGPDEWLPPNVTFRCAYYAQWRAVLLSYPLDSAETVAKLDADTASCSEVFQ